MNRKPCPNTAMARSCVAAVFFLAACSPSIADNCSPQDPVRRATSGPQFSVWDHLITDSPGTDPSGGKNASLSLSYNGLLSVAYERPDPDNAGGNALSIQRFDVTDMPLQGRCVCDDNDDCPLRLYDAPINGTIFSHVSIAAAREGGTAVLLDLTSA